MGEQHPGGAPAAAPGAAYPSPTPGGYPPPVPTYLAPAILTTILCCPPLGIVSILYAGQVTSRLAAGDVAGARASSRRARRYAWVAAGTWAVVIGGYALFLVVAAIFRSHDVAVGRG